MLEGLGLGWAGTSFLTACCSQGAYPRSPPARIRRTDRDPVRWRQTIERCGLRLEHRPLRDDALRHIAPQGHQKLARQRHNRNPADPAARLSDALLEPLAQGRARLMAQ